MRLKGYLLILLLCNTCFSLLYALLAAAPFFSVRGSVALLTVLIVLINALTAALCRALPVGWADPSLSLYRVSTEEKRFYERCRIRLWKDRIPELGHLTGVRKNKLEQPGDKAYLLRFLTECCYGQLCHGVSVFSILPLLLFVPTVAGGYAFLLNAVLNLAPIAVLRYNSYKLMRVYQRMD